MFITVTHNTTAIKESVCSTICSGMPENGGLAEALLPLTFEKGDNRGECAFSLQYHR